MKLHFYGAARSVTGANYLLEIGDKKILVDCGMFQGSLFADEKNYEPFPYNPKKIDYLFITHAHTDHIGRIPKLIKEGFGGKIICTPPTRDLSELSLIDSAHLIAQEAKIHGRQPIYEESDVAPSMSLFQPAEYGRELNLGGGVTAILRDAGHILGSSIFEFHGEGKKIVFTGDLGNPPTPLLKSTEYVNDADYLVIESAYGNRFHERKEERKNILEDTIEDVVSVGGVLMIPAFAMERTQELLYELNELVENHRIPKIQIFIDSPLAIKATEIYKKYPEYYNKEAAYLIESGDDLFRFPGLKFTQTKEESKTINDAPPPKVIIAGSGMSQGGRIMHHEIRYLPDPKSIFLVIGYQVPGSLGRRILEKSKEVKIFDQPVAVRAQIRAIGAYSAHADQDGLFYFVMQTRKTLKKVFVVQGEEDASLALAQRIRDHLGIDASAPMLYDIVEL